MDGSLLVTREGVAVATGGLDVGHTAEKRHPVYPSPFPHLPPPRGCRGAFQARPAWGTLFPGTGSALKPGSRPLSPLLPHSSLSPALLSPVLTDDPVERTSPQPLSLGSHTHSSGHLSRVLASPSVLHRPPLLIFPLCLLPLSSPHCLSVWPSSVPLGPGFFSLSHSRPPFCTPVPPPSHHSFSSHHAPSPSPPLLLMQ